MPRDAETCLLEPTFGRTGIRGATALQVTIVVRAVPCLAVVLVLALGASACGGGGSTKTSAAETQAIDTYRAGLTRWGREMIGALNGLSILFSSPTAVQQIEAGDRGVGLKLVRFERALAGCTTTVRALGPPPTVYELVHSHALRACTSLEKGARLVKQGVREFQSGLGVDRFTEAAGPLNDGQGDIGLVRSELKPAAS